MKVVLTILFLIFSFETYAQFSYSDTAKKLGLNIISIGNPWTFPGVHRIYTDPAFNRAMLIMENVKGTRLKFKMTEYNKYLLLEYPVSKTEFNSIAFINLTKEEVFNPSTSDTGNVKNPLKNIYNLLIPKAHASETCETSTNSSIDTDFNGLMEYFSTGYFQVASSCLMGILEGIWGATGGLAESCWDGLVTLVNDPQGFWDEKVTQFQRLKAFLMDFETNIQKTITSFKKLPDETKAQMLCSFIGGIGTDILITFLTVGSGSAKLIASLNNYLGKLIKIESFLSKLNKLGKISELPSKFYQNLAKGLVSEKRLRSIQSLSHHEFDDVAFQLVRCSL